MSAMEVRKIQHTVPVSCCLLADAGGPPCGCAPAPHRKPPKGERLRLWWDERREALAQRIAPWIAEEDP